MRRLFLCLIPIWLLARLYTPGPNPDLNWLDGAWHDPERPSTRLLWTQTDQQGAHGLLTSDQQTTVLWVDPVGRLTVRELGPQMNGSRPAQQQSLLKQGPQELIYRRGSLRYLTSRSDSGEFLLNLDGKSWSLRRD